MGGLFKTPKAPEPPPLPEVMPIADDDEIAKAKRKRLSAMQARGGRAATILTDGNGTGGGNTTLGG